MENDAGPAMHLTCFALPGYVPIRASIPEAGYVDDASVAATGDEQFRPPAPNVTTPAAHGEKTLVIYVSREQWEP